MTDSPNIGAVILAAGSSSRLGRPKQLLPYKGTTLLQRMIDMVAAFRFTSSLVVLGAHAKQIRDAIDPGESTVVVNDHWADGMASSIRVGVEESLMLNRSLDSILFLLSDQPFVATGLIRELLTRHSRGTHRITACSYQQHIGVPAIISRYYVPELLELNGDVGAKKIMMKHRDDVAEIPFEQGRFDIDTKEDYERLRENTEGNSC
ncbi:MAG: nucleotidyltransferase family protein [Balneolaceae bacterium]|nr:nucleotidyltransferase family protein [Balneolaceae bacterium]